MAKAFSLGSANAYVKGFYLVGVICTLYITWSVVYYIIKFLAKFFLSKWLGVRLNMTRLGSWAVVTGCTDGIGKAYAEQLAETGLNIVLISRSDEKLAELSKFIEKKYQMETRVIVADFTQTDVYDNINRNISDLDIAVLVNNVGVSYDHPEYFDQIPNLHEKVREIVNVNVLSMSMMCATVLPMMLSKGKGAIINVSSFAAEMPMGLISIYSASKAYVDYLSRALHYEYKDRGITVQSVRPGYVATKLSKIRKVTLMAPSPTTFVKSALGLLGIESEGSGYWLHSLISGFVKVFPRWMVDSYIYSIHESVRKRAMQKKSK